MQYNLMSPAEGAMDAQSHTHEMLGENRPQGPGGPARAYRYRLGAETPLPLPLPRPQGPGGPARAYRYRLALGRAYRYRYRPARAHRYRSERAVTGSFLVSPFYFNFS